MELFMSTKSENPVVLKAKSTVNIKWYKLSSARTGSFRYKLNRKTFEFRVIILPYVRAKLANIYVLMNQMTKSWPFSNNHVCNESKRVIR